MNEALARPILDDGAESISYGARRPTPSPHGGLSLDDVEAILTREVKRQWH